MVDQPITPVLALMGVVKALINALPDGILNETAFYDTLAELRDEMIVGNVSDESIDVLKWFLELAEQNPDAPNPSPDRPTRQLSLRVLAGGRKD